MRPAPSGSAALAVAQLAQPAPSELLDRRRDERVRVWKWCRCAPRERPARSATRVVVVDA